MRRLQWLGVEARIFQFEVPAAKIRAVLGPQLLNYLERFVEPAEPAGSRMKRNSELLMLKLEPSGTHPENQPAAADDVDGGRHLCQHRGMPISIAGYHQTEADPPRRHRERCQGSPTFKTWSGWVGKDRQKMIKAPRTLVSQVIDLAP